MTLVPDAGRLAEHAAEIRLTGKHLYREPPHQPPDVEPPPPDHDNTLSGAPGGWLAVALWGLAALTAGALIGAMLP